ncbi:M24 family metallopeptidase [Archaeoglobus profundus]|uniref:Peptidase M24 n=1 Tax=Archaeoglobus profundus (strain DSM 5631 / JCM 9629 / NBRC 100127 / Av18) TaxID=572546 RepID=D2RG25_ARCPA|nr:peptidase M24 [Archaeoglobus profundus DSM 5631]
MEFNDYDFFVQHADINLYYATKFKAIDLAFYIVGNDGTDLLLVPDMEKERAVRESRVKEIASFGDLGYHDLRKELKDSRKAQAEMLIRLLKTHKARRVGIPTDFPAYLAIPLSQAFEVKVVKSPFLKMRAVKTQKEIEYIGDTSKAIISAFEFALKLLRREKSCDRIRERIENYLYLKGYLASDTIISSGKLSAIPHASGGIVEDHVVMDIFPRSRKHYYYSDFTRTVIVNRNDKIEEMLNAVIEAQEKAISIIREGITAKDVHYTVCDVLESYGYKTLRQKANEGFIHSTGHGVGLEVHEEPRIFENETVLEAGMVFTVEPGLYYKDIGGVRVEDVVVVRKNGCEVLTEYPKRIYLNSI